MSSGLGVRKGSPQAPKLKPYQAKRGQIWLTTRENVKGFVVGADVQVLDEFVVGDLYFFGSDDSQTAKLKLTELTEPLTTDNHPLR